MIRNWTSWRSDIIFIRCISRIAAMGTSGPRWKKALDYLFAVLKPVHVNAAGEVSITDLDLFLGRDYLITVQEGECPTVRTHLDQLHATAESFASGPALLQSRGWHCGCLRAGPRLVQRGDRRRSRIRFWKSLRPTTLQRIFERQARADRPAAGFDQHARRRQPSPAAGDRVDPARPLAVSAGRVRSPGPQHGHGRRCSAICSAGRWTFTFPASRTARTR